jgi:BirA family transcriptional regulator, biotin operon repressor / biotin---[acetyl-CoA-carboxylase] ligase
MHSLPIGHTIEWFDTLESTNTHATTLIPCPNSHGVVVAAHFQTMGRGQKGNYWESAWGKNLTASIILKPEFLKPHEQFLLSKAVSLALSDTLSPLLKGVKVKWPNDIYVNDSKIAGVLIENSIMGAELSSCIVGIGLNVNQTSFPDDIPNPTSLCLALGAEQELHPLLESLCACLNNRYKQLQADAQGISEQYHNTLYRRESYHPYSTGGKVFMAMIHCVKPSGELELETEGGEIVGYQFKEVSFCL